MTPRPGLGVLLLVLIAAPLWIFSCLHVMAAMPPWWGVAHGAAALAVGGVLLACGSSVRAWLRERQALGLLQRARQPCPPDLAAQIADITPSTTVYLLMDPTPMALCAGLFHPAIYLSTSLIDGVPISALRAALAHEEAHRRRRDPLRRFLWSLLADVILPSGWTHLHAQRVGLYAELVADRHARRVTSTRDLAHALLAVVHPVSPSSSVATSHLHAGASALDARLAALAQPSTAPLRLPANARRLLLPVPPLPHLVVVGAGVVFMGIIITSPAVLVCLFQH